MGNDFQPPNDPIKPETIRLTEVAQPEPTNALPVAASPAPRPAPQIQTQPVGDFQSLSRSSLIRGTLMALFVSVAFAIVGGRWYMIPFYATQSALFSVFFPNSNDAFEAKTNLALTFDQFHMGAAADHLCSSMERGLEADGGDHSPFTSYLQLVHARVLVHNSQFDRAEQLAQKALRNLPPGDPSEPDVVNQMVILGDDFVGEGLYKAAAAVDSEAVARWTDRPHDSSLDRAAEQTSRVYEKLGDKSKALEYMNIAYKDAVKQNFRYDQARYIREIARLAVSLGLYEQAEQITRNAWAADNRTNASPDLRAQSAHWRGSALLHMNLVPEALRQLEFADKQLPERRDYPQKLQNSLDLAAAYKALGRKDDAQKTLLDAVGLLRLNVVCSRHCLHAGDVIRKNDVYERYEPISKVPENSFDNEDALIGQTATKNVDSLVTIRGDAIKSGAPERNLDPDGFSKRIADDLDSLKK